MLMRTNSKIMSFMQAQYNKPIGQMSFEIYTDRFVPDTP